MYGAATVTYDADICFDFSRQNIEKLRSALKDLHPRARAQKGWRSLDDLPLEQLENLKNLYLQTDSGGLDLLGSLFEIGDFRQVKNHSTIIELFGRPCPVIDIETLIRIKEKLGRPKDRQVVLELKTILEKRKGPK